MSKKSRKNLLTHRFAVGHSEGKVARPWYLTRSAYPAGGLCCHVNDLLRYGRFHLGDGTFNGKRLISTELLALCHTPQFSIWGKESIEYKTADLEPYVGKYDRGFAEIELGILGGQMIGQQVQRRGFPDQHTPSPPPPPPATLMPTGEDQFVVTDGPMARAEVHFIRRADGSIGCLRLGMRAYQRQ